MFILTISNENINPEYLNLLQNISPVKPLELRPNNLTIIQKAFELCVILNKRRVDKLNFSQLKDCSNMLIALMISQYLEQSISGEKFTRFEMIHKTLSMQLENNFKTLKRPS